MYTAPPPPPTHTQKYIRAHFNYNGRLDEEIPCKALGLSFHKGDILEISNQDDPNWWQVYTCTLSSTERNTPFTMTHFDCTGQ